MRLVPPHLRLPVSPSHSTGLCLSVRCVWRAWQDKPQEDEVRHAMPSQLSQWPTPFKVRELLCLCCQDTLQIHASVLRKQQEGQSITEVCPT